MRFSIGDNFFAPDEVTVAVGSTVTWQIDAGENPHDVVATDGSFRSNMPMNRGDIFSYTFTKAGEYAYVCSFHKQIVVHRAGDRSRLKVTYAFQASPAGQAVDRSASAASAVSSASVATQTVSAAGSRPTPLFPSPPRSASVAIR